MCWGGRTGPKSAVLSSGTTAVADHLEGGAPVQASGAAGSWVHASGRHMAEVREGTLQAEGGHTLFHKSWLPAHGAAPDAHLVYFCGVHESLELTSLDRIVAAAVPRGWAVHGHEYHGHGRSSKLAGYVESLELLMQHCTAYMDLVMAETEGTSPDQPSSSTA
jgi:alpha-beta hydrolase superfamily lysophospholipase